MTFRDDLRDLNDRLSAPDDAPLWAEVLGMVLAPFVALRGGLHALTALVGSDLTGETIDPHLVGHGVTLASPVRGLRGHRFDRVARFLVGVVGIGAWTLVGFDVIGHAGVRWWLRLNILACAADPALFLGDRLRNRLQDNRDTVSMSYTNATTDGGTD